MGRGFGMWALLGMYVLWMVACLCDPEKDAQRQD